MCIRDRIWAAGFQSTSVLSTHRGLFLDSNASSYHHSKHTGHPNTLTVLGTSSEAQLCSNILEITPRKAAGRNGAPQPLEPKEARRPDANTYESVHSSRVADIRRWRTCEAKLYQPETQRCVRPRVAVDARIRTHHKILASRRSSSFAASHSCRRCAD